MLESTYNLLKLYPKIETSKSLQVMVNMLDILFVIEVRCQHIIIAKSSFSLY